MAPIMADAKPLRRNRQDRKTSVQVSSPWRDLVRAAAALRDRASDEWDDGAKSLARSLWAVSAQLDPAGHKAAGPAPWELSLSKPRTRRCHGCDKRHCADDLACPHCGLFVCLEPCQDPGHEPSGRLGRTTTTGMEASAGQIIPKEE